jgi:hypothetical protein
MVICERHPPLSASRTGAPRRLLLAALLLCLLGACTFTFYYRQLDWLIPWELSDYITIDASQRSELERRLVERLDWHCSTQLSAYAAWFREMRDESYPFTRADVERHYWRSVEFWDALILELTPDIVALLRGASDAQVGELLANLERQTRKLEKRYVTAGGKWVQQRRIDRMAEILQRWIGALNREQYQALERWSADLGRSGEGWIESRRRWRRALGEALAVRGEEERFAARIHTLFVEPQTLWPESYRREYDRLRSRTLDMLAEVAAAEAPGQQHYFRGQLLSWAKDFESLACPLPEVASSQERGNAEGGR